MIAMNIVYAATAYPAGFAADRLSARGMLILGLLALVVADLVLATAHGSAQVFAGAGVWGLHMGLTQGLLSKLIADTAPPDLRGSAFGVFNLVSGGALLLASVIAGALWSAYGPTATFLSGAAFAAVALMGLLFYREKAGSL
jgi:MFS family permease